jgi:hypothetical protein
MDCVVLCKKLLSITPNAHFADRQKVCFHTASGLSGRLQFLFSTSPITSRSQKSALGLFIAVSSADNLAKGT